MRVTLPAPTIAPPLRNGDEECSLWEQSCLACDPRHWRCHALRFALRRRACRCTASAQTTGHGAAWVDR
jgi:hypothetical protein